MEQVPGKITKVVETIEPQEHRARMIQLSQELGSRLKKKQEKGEWPPVSFHFFLSAHDSREDVEGLRGIIQNSDIFLSESSGWSQPKLQYYDKVAEGLGLTSPAAATSQDRAIFSALHGTKKPVGFVDLSYEDTAAAGYKDSVVNLNYQKLMSSGYERALENVATLIEKISQENMHREEKMVGQIMPQLERIVNSNKKLKRNESLNVSVFLGSAHAEVFEQIRSAGIPATCTLKDQGEHPTFFEQQLTSASQGNKIEMGSVQQHTMLFELFLFDKLYGRLKDKTPLSRKVSDTILYIEKQFTLPEIERVLKAGSMIKSTQVFFELLGQKNIKIPASLEEVDAMANLL